MKIKNILPVFILCLIVATISSCSTAKLSSQANDDVYFSDISANEVVYTSIKNNIPVVRGIGDENLDYYDESVYNTRLNGLNNYSWRDYYYQNNGLAFDPFWNGGFNSFNNFYGYGANNFFNNGWAINIGIGRPLWGFNNFYDPFFNPWNNFNSFYGNGAFGNGFGSIYSFNRFGGFYGNGFGNNGWGNNFYIDPIINARPNNPRPRGSYDNVRSGGNVGGRNINLPPNTRPARPEGVGSSMPTRTVDENRNPSSGTTSVRPSRPTGTSSGGVSGTTSRPTQSTMPRPTRDDSATSSPMPSRSSDSGSSSSGRSSSSGSSSSGGTSSPRPTRPGGN
jgi:hypothetical protein